MQESSNNGPSTVEMGTGEPKRAENAIQLRIMQMSERLRLLREENELLRRGSEGSSVKASTFGSQDGDMTSMGVNVLAIIDKAGIPDGGNAKGSSEIPVQQGDYWQRCQSCSNSRGCCC